MIVKFACATKIDEALKKAPYWRKSFIYTLLFAQQEKEAEKCKHKTLKMRGIFFLQSVSAKCTHNALEEAQLFLWGPRSWNLSLSSETQTNFNQFETVKIFLLSHISSCNVKALANFSISAVLFQGEWKQTHLSTRQTRTHPWAAETWVH